MLLPKNLFTIIYIIYNQKNIKVSTSYNLIYSILLNSFIFNYIILNYLIFFFKRHIKFLCTYNLKLAVPNWIIFNSIVLLIFKKFKNLHCFKKLKFNIIKKKIKRYTLLRSPFKYKKSREYLGYSSYIGIIGIEYNIITFFTMFYLEFYILQILEKILKFNFIINRSIKII